MLFSLIILRHLFAIIASVQRNENRVVMASQIRFGAGGKVLIPIPIGESPPVTLGIRRQRAFEWPSRSKTRRSAGWSGIRS
jgi:hypothetical protein